jgi:hypothetical protein
MPERRKPTPSAEVKWDRGSTGRRISCAAQFLRSARSSMRFSEGKDLLSELQRLALQTQMEEYAMCARVCPECLTLRRQRPGCPG